MKSGSSFPISQSPDTRRLRFFTPGSFMTLNHHWRLGPLFQPIDRISFSFPFDGEERIRCLQLVLEFFRSLAPGVQHIKHIYLSLGVIWDREDKSASIDYTLFRSLLRELHRSGCKSLSIMSVDILDQACRKEPGSDILINVQDEQMCLESLSLETAAFSSPTLTPWFMKQVTGNSTIAHLKLSSTGLPPPN